ncbi:MAG: endonuclease/exonuclease/phosphatase family protein [Clostridia bacterium]|nr:endonuclease/exonuclease/phosphatase family protein [Clostridia bacterium]MDD4386867.1 endonuclease/exonuclease/phosphatase family protein [Clostridia bacterium]
MKYKVITFNMCHGDNNNGIIDVINQSNILKEYNADLIMLQEVDICTSRSEFKNQLYEFKKNFDFEYSCFGSNITYKEGWYGNAILSRYPIVSSENYLTTTPEYSKETKGMLHAEINVDGKYINVFNMHLPVFEKERITFSEAIIKMMVRNNISGDIILGGDFNFGKIPLGNHRYKVKKLNSYTEFENIKKIFQCPDFSVNTWPTGNPIADIDKIMYSGDIKFDEIRRLNVEISDHYPVYAEFTI